MTTPFYPQQPQQPQYPPQPMYPAQPGPQYQPPQQQQPYVPPPTQQPGFAPPPAYPQAPQGVDLNARLSGPGIPPELQGRTVGEGLRYYGVMREDFVRRQQAQQQQQPLQGQPPQGQPQQHPQQPGFPSAQPRGTAPQGAPADPMRQYVADAIREVMPEFINPVVQPMQQQNLERTYNGVKSRYPDWQQYEAEIIQSLQGADIATLNNPAAWDAAYKYAVGNAYVRQRQGQPQQPQYQQPPQGGGPPMPQGYQQQPQQAPQYQPPFQVPNQPLAQTFVEGPTPPAPQFSGANGQGADPRDEVFAQRFGVPVEVYRSWKGGRVGMLPRPGQQVPQDVWGNALPQPQQGGPPGYPPQGYAPQGSYSPPPPPGFYQPPVNGASYGR